MDSNRLDKITTSVGVFTVGAWYLGTLSGHLLRISGMSNSRRLSVVSLSGETGLQLATLQPSTHRTTRMG